MDLSELQALRIQELAELAKSLKYQMIYLV